MEVKKSNNVYGDLRHHFDYELKDDDDGDIDVDHYRDQSNNNNKNSSSLLGEKELHEILELEKQSEKLLQKVAKQNGYDLPSQSSSRKPSPIRSTRSSRRPSHESASSMASSTSGAHHLSLASSLSQHLHRLDVLSWYKSWKCKKRDCKIQCLSSNLLPKLKVASEKLRSWLDDVSGRKKMALSHASQLYRELKEAVSICQTHVNVYDDIFNDCLQIGLDIKKELIVLKNSLEFSREIIESSKIRKEVNEDCYHGASHHGHHHRHHHHGHGHGRSTPSPARRVNHQVNNSTPVNVNDPCPATEPAVWQGYQSPATHVFVAKSPGMVSLVDLAAASKLDTADMARPRSVSNGSESPAPVDHHSISDAFRGLLSRSRSYSSSLPSAEAARAVTTSNQTPSPFLTSKQRSSSLRMFSTSKTSTHGSTESLTTVNNSGDKRCSLQLHHSAFSLNSNFVDFNTNACTAELNQLVTESESLMSEVELAGHDVTVEDMSQQLRKLKEVKGAIIKLIQEIKLASQGMLLSFYE